MTGSPPWLTDEWDLSGDIAKIGQQWPTLRRILEDATLFDRRDSEVSGWSCGQHAGHSLLVAAVIAERIEGNLGDPDRNSGEQPHELAHHVFTKGGFRRGVATAPPEALPEGRSREDYLSMLPEVVAAWEAIETRADELPGCAARARHFTLGHLTSTEWVRMCAVHTAHHLRLVLDIAGDERLLAAPGGGA